jgi:PAS domain S-box-containing protein
MSPDALGPVTPPPPGAAALIAARDWSPAGLPPFPHWPEPLLSTTLLMLGAKLPMLVLWGREGHLIYNDSAAEIAGARHPGCLGAPIRQAWPELTALNQQALDTCFAGQPFTLRETHLVVQRNDYPEDVWLDGDYSPLSDAGGNILGLFAVLSDVTLRVLADWRRSEAENQLAMAIAATGLGTWDRDLVNNNVYWSDSMRALFGIFSPRPVSMDELFALLHPDDRAPVAAALARTRDPDIRAGYDIEYRSIGAEDGVLRWVAAKGRAIFNDDGVATRITGTARDITTRKMTELRHACLVALSDRLRPLETTAGITAAAAEILARHLDCPRAGYAVLRGEEAFVEADWTDGQTPSLVGPRLFSALGEPYCAPLRAGRTLAIDDIATHPATTANAAPWQRLGVGALISAPLIENGRLVAILYVHSPAPRLWSAAEIALVEDIVDRTWEAFGRAEAAQSLRQLNERLEQEVAQRTAQRDRMWRLSSDVMVVTDGAGIIASVNPAWRAAFDWSERDLIGHLILDFAHPEDRAALAAGFVHPAPGPVRTLETRLRRREGDYLWLAWRTVPDDDSIHGVGRDITAEREQAEALQAAEAALRQAQKMEAVGQLTGGIAHDFNNLLQGIVGALDLVEKRLDEQRHEDVPKFISAARASASRAVALTHRLLAFSRRQPLDPKPVAANPLVAAMEELLRRTMGERIAMSLSLADDLWLTLCDPHQLESAVLNLAINARDAMPDGGQLILETTNTVLDARYAARIPEVKPGEFICLSVTDTGTGMPPSVIEQAFEPFYTTKPLGQGTGLGLSMIYGFIKQSGGHARIHSEVGRGTTVKFFLPRYAGVADGPRDAATPRATAQRPAHATVLVVEDEDIVRSLVVEVLDDLGLTALEAATGPSGLEILRSDAVIDLLITDIGLPGINGRQMAEAARLVRPDLKILFMTGYAEAAAAASGFLEPGMAMITKPFPIDTLTERVRGMIGS